MDQRAASERDPVMDALTTMEHENLSQVVEMLTQLDQLARRGLSVDEMASEMATRFDEPPGGGAWDGPTVTRVMAVVDSVRDERGIDPDPDDESWGPWDDDDQDPYASYDYDPDKVEEEIVEADHRDRRWAWAGLAALALLALGTGGAYAALQDSQSPARSTTEGLTSLTEATATSTTEAPNPADLMGIRIEPTPAETGSGQGDLVAATATIKTDGLLHLEGAFRSQQEVDAFIESAAAVFGRESIVESYVIDPAAPVAEVSDVALDKPVLFETGTATIDPSYIPFLEACGDVLRLNPHITMSISGFTDSVGDAEFNLELSQRRAQAIVDFYRSLEIDDSQLIGVGYGEADPIADNENADGRQQNRRAMLQLLNVMGADESGTEETAADE
jgi:outer membrane protein OmpA-like peptidoglycan-associated protein